MSVDGIFNNIFFLFDDNPEEVHISGPRGWLMNLLTHDQKVHGIASSTTRPRDL